MRFRSGVMLTILSPTHGGETSAMEGKARLWRGGGGDHDGENEKNCGIATAI